jgi:hypothetical protein
VQLWDKWLWHVWGGESKNILVMGSTHFTGLFLAHTAGCKQAIRFVVLLQCWLFSMSKYLSDITWISMHAIGVLQPSFFSIYRNTFLSHWPWRVCTIALGDTVVYSGWSTSYKIAGQGNWMRNCPSIHQRLVVLFPAKQNSKDNSTNWVYEFRASMSIESLGKFIEE